MCGGALLPFVRPELQHLAVGDMVPMLPGGRMAWWVKEFEVNRSLVWWDRKGETTWVWGLYPLDDNRTRLISRAHMRYHWRSPLILAELVLDVGDIVMMRKCLLGIKQRAERNRELMGCVKAPSPVNT